LNIALFLRKKHYFSFLGALTIGIQNSYILQEKYEPHLSDKARCSEMSRFSITKIWYVAEPANRTNNNKSLRSTVVKVKTFYFKKNNFFFTFFKNFFYL